MADLPIVLVTGATGAQGGAVARHLLESGKYRVRCLTRKPGSDKALALSAAGAEVIEGNLDDAPGVSAAVEGCEAVFCVTNFWEHQNREFDQGKNVSDACKAHGVRHLVQSTLPSPARITGGAFLVPHFDVKAQLEEYTRSLGIPVTFVHVAFYYENFLTYFKPQPLGDGTFIFGFPQGDTPLAGVAVDDVGGVVAAILAQRGRMLGRIVGIVGEDIPCTEYAAVLSRVTGRTIRYRHVPREVFASYGFPGADDLAAMFDFNRLHVLNRRQELEECYSLYPGMRSFSAWAEAHKDECRLG